MTNPNYVPEDEVADPWGAGGYAYPAYVLEDEPQQNGLFSHTGTLDTTGYGNGAPRTIVRAGQPDFLAGPDTSARAISPIFDEAPLGSVAGPAYTDPIY